MVGDIHQDFLRKLRIGTPVRTKRVLSPDEHIPVGVTRKMLSEVNNSSILRMNLEYGGDMGDGIALGRTVSTGEKAAELGNADGKY